MRGGTAQRAEESPPSPDPAVLTVTACQSTEQTQGCHAHGLPLVAQLGLQEQDRLLWADASCGEEIPSCISKQLWERAAGTPRGIATAPLLTLQQDALAQLCLLVLAVLFGVGSELWEQGGNMVEKVPAALRGPEKKRRCQLSSPWALVARGPPAKTQPTPQRPQGPTHRSGAPRSHPGAKAEQHSKTRGSGVLPRLSQEGIAVAVWLQAPLTSLYTTLLMARHLPLGTGI